MEEDSNQKENKTTHSKNFIHLFPTPYQNNPKFVKLWDAYCEDRKARKEKDAVTYHIVEIFANRFRKVCKGNIPLAIEVLEYSIENGWKRINPEQYIALKQNLGSYRNNGSYRNKSNDSLHLALQPNDPDNKPKSTKFANDTKTIVFDLSQPQGGRNGKV